MCVCVCVCVCSSETHLSVWIESRDRQPALSLDRVT